MELDKVNWSAAAVELADEHRRTGTPKARRALAAVSSLRGRFSDDFTLAAASTTAAIALEPLDPIHRVRDALVRLRFGDLDGAIARLDALPEAVADLPLVLVVKSLAIARRGEPRTARNIADRALQVDGRHAGAKFLHTETNLAASTKGGLDKLSELPKGAAYDAAWADLLARLAIMRPGDAKAVAAQLERGVISKGTRADTLARTVIAWTAASADELARAAEAQPANSRAEQLALALLADKLEEPAAAVKMLRALNDRVTDRPAVRRALVAALTRLAMDEATNERFSNALRAVAVCSELEPHEAAHYQNRAALFTLLGEHESALDAWADLDRHHYRLALLGRLDATSARRYGAPHRMFSQAARLSGRTGVFVVEETKEGAITNRELVVNQEVIDKDPEQLRQWLHHTRAALVFGFVSLGTDRDRVLLVPSTPAVAEARAEGLCSLAQSLAVLVPDEGRRLADKLAVRFRAAAASAPMRYAAPELAPDALAVHRHAVETFAELGMLALRWEPDPTKRAVFDEVLDTVRAVAPLFDETVLDGMLVDRQEAATVAPHALRFLDQVMRVVLEVQTRNARLDPAQRKRLGDVMVANLRTSLVERRVIDAKSDLSRHEVESLVEQLDLARKDDQENARLEYWAAHLLMVGDFLDEAVDAIARFHQIAKGEHPLASRIERIQELIDEKKQHGKGKTRSGDHKASSRANAGDDRDISAREAELELQPTSMQLYTELCHELALADRWRDAHAWAARALARCLTPAGQTRARELSLELLGLEVLGARDPGAMASYIAGARASAVPALETFDSATTIAGLEYLRGLCLLAADRRKDAQAAFARALQRCTRGIYLAVLRPLAQDVETAVLEAAKKDIGEALADGRFRDAFERIAERMSTVARPEPYVIELARTQLSALLPTIGSSDVPIGPPPIRVEAAWRGDLAKALELRVIPDRIRALAALAAKVHEPSVREADALMRKLDDLDEQLAMAAALDESTKRAAAGDHTGALALLADLGPAGEKSARVLRQRVIMFLRLERYTEADAEIAKLAQLPEPLAREFTARYPGLKFRQQIAAASAFVRGKDFAKARTLLADLRPAAPDQEVELAYCKAYCAAADGYRAKDAGDREGSRRLLLEALRYVEEKLSDARLLKHERLLELHQKLEADQ